MHDKLIVKTKGAQSSSHAVEFICDGSDGWSPTWSVAQKKYLRLWFWNVWRKTWSCGPPGMSSKFGSVLVRGSTLFTTLFIELKENLMLSPIWNFISIYMSSCSAGSHLPCNCRSLKTLRRQVKIKADPLCLPCASKVELLIVHLMQLLSYRCTREVVLIKR